MEENFYNDGFEEFLQNQVKDHRMFPSDGVWRGIYKRLHGNTNWPALTIAAFAFLAAIIAISVYFSPSPDIFADIPPVKITATDNAPDRKESSNTNNLLSSTSSKNLNKAPAVSYVENPGMNSDVAEIVVEDRLLAATPGNQAIAGNHISTASIEETSKQKANTIIHLPQTYNTAEKADADKTVVLKSSAELNSSKSVETGAVAEADANNKTGLEKLDVSKNSEIKDEVKENADKGIVSDLKQPAKNLSLAKKESKIKKNKFSYLVYITPSRSYRKLTEDPAIHSGTAADGGPVAQNFVLDVNQVVRHKPGAGIEAGVSLAYNISNRLKITSGVQFNVRQYAMEAYFTPTEVGTIALRRPEGIDLVSSFSYYRAASGYSPVELINRYYQLSVPVGVEWKVAGNRNVQLNVAASVQPIYLTDHSSYLLTTDFKNYTSGLNYVRNWNMNTNLEAFISIRSGDFNWHLGPQFRYQNLPTFITQYPIREHLIDYGVKIGVSKNLQ